MNAPETPFITVVVPVRNESRHIEETLASLLAQEYPVGRCEIIVADGGSSDGTREQVQRLASRDPRVRLVDNPAGLSSSGRNAGFRLGKGDLFLVVDGHCHIPDARLLRQVERCFRESGADCLGRPQPLDPPGLSVFQQAVAAARGSWLGHGGDSLIYSRYEGFASPVSNGAAYRRSVFEKVGYVDERFDACEDVEFNYRVERAGLRCYTSPALTVKYYPRESVAGLFRQMVRYGSGRRRFMSKHPAAVTTRQLVPAAFTLGLAALLAAACVSPFVPAARWGVKALLPPYGAYALVVLGESLRLAAGRGWRLLPSLPVVFPAIHLGLGWGFLREAIRR